MNGDGSYVTRAELREELGRFKTELKSELKTELKTELDGLKREVHLDIANAMNYLAEHMSVQMNKLREDLTYQIANAAQVAAEEHRREHGSRPRAPRRRPRT